eukprot:29820-Pelagococcus_subviridis.AAC.2
MGLSPRRMSASGNGSSEKSSSHRNATRMSSALTPSIGPSQCAGTILSKSHASEGHSIRNERVGQSKGTHAIEQRAFPNRHRVHPRAHRPRILRVQKRPNHGRDDQPPGETIEVILPPRRPLHDADPTGRGLLVLGEEVVHEEARLLPSPEGRSIQKQFSGQLKGGAIKCRNRAMGEKLLYRTHLRRFSGVSSGCASAVLSFPTSSSFSGV